MRYDETRGLGDRLICVNIGMVTTAEESDEWCISLGVVKDEVSDNRTMLHGDESGRIDCVKAEEECLNWTVNGRR
jgi:hypothetical protein